MARSKKGSSARQKAWDALSKLIRVRDAIYTTGTTDEATCVTCGNRYPIKQLQAGHYVPGRTNGILFDERGVHAQCARCNHQGGAWPEYDEWMRSRYGQSVCDQLKWARHQNVQYKGIDYEIMRGRYQARTKQMLETGEIDAESWEALPRRDGAA